jgi:hypothetical protein
MDPAANNSPPLASQSKRFAQRPLAIGGSYLRGQLAFRRLASDPAAKPAKD